MAVPSATVWASPTGIKLPDGFSSKITFALDDTIELWEKDVTPPAVDGGDAVDQTTMCNTTWRTKLPRNLLSLEDVSAVCAYDPAVYDSIIGIINVNTTITVLFPDGSTLAFFGYLKRFEPSTLVEADQPEATLTIVATNLDPADTTVEAGPTMVEVAGC